MAFTFRLVAGVIAMLAVAGAATAQKKDAAATPPPDTVRLRFGWPVGLTARVSAHKFRARSSDGKTDTINVQLAYRLTVLPHARGRLVRFHDFEVPGVPVLAEVEERVSALMPSVVVDTTGALVAIEGVEGMRRELDAFLGPVALRKVDSLRPETRAMLERLRSPEVLTALAEYEWNALVGTWIDADFIVGLTYEAEYELPFPLFPGVMLPMVQEFSAIGRVPCHENESERRCVELESFTHPDKDAFRAILDRLLSQMTVPDTAQMPAIDDYDLETEIRLIAEPATLIPYGLAVTKRVTMWIKAGPGPAAEATQIETKTTRYEYDSPRQ
jgi:hypothetical protein